VTAFWTIIIISKTDAGGNPCRLAAVAQCYAKDSPLLTLTIMTQVENNRKQNEMLEIMPHDLPLKLMVFNATFNNISVIS
jgi:hypothetical protein